MRRGFDLLHLFLPFKFEPSNDDALIMTSGWAAQSTAYADLHRITFARCHNMPDFIGRLRTAHYRLSTAGLELPETQLVYVLLTGLGIEFDSWISDVRKRTKTPSFDALADELIASFPHMTKPLTKPAMLKASCSHCGLDHPSDNCHKLFT